jgi:hypothetical protein
MQGSDFLTVKDIDGSDDGVTAERMAQAASFASFLAGHLLDAVMSDENELRWSDGVFAAGLAVRVLGEMVNIVSTSHGIPVDQNDLKARIDALLSKASAGQVQIMKMKDREEMEAFMRDATQGFH